MAAPSWQHNDSAHQYRVRTSHTRGLLRRRNPVAGTTVSHAAGRGSSHTVQRRGGVRNGIADASEVRTHRRSRLEQHGIVLLAADLLI
jgi:hypothetical protein